MKNFLRICVMFFLLSFLEACERRPLVEFGGQVKVRVVLDTKDIPNVTTGIYNDKIKIPFAKPETFRVMFYHRNTKELVSQAFISKGS